MTAEEIELIRTLGEFLPPEVIEKWIKEEKKKRTTELIQLCEKEDN